MYHLNSFGNDAFIMGSMLETLAIGISDENSMERVSAA